MSDLNNVLTENQVAELLAGSMKDPFTLLGMHTDEKGVTIRTIQHGAVSIAVRERGNDEILEEMTRVTDAIFTCRIPRRKKHFKYELVITYDNGYQKITADPYSFLPVLTEEDTYLFNEGNHHYIYNKMGSHQIEHDGIMGTHFAVWAPSAQRVSVVGNFNCFDGRQHPMRMLGSSGVWEIFIPGVGEGEVYKYEVKKGDSGHLVLKTDPYCYQQEPFPNFGSIVKSVDRFNWSDSEWIKKRSVTSVHAQPVSIYELHLGSWRKSGPDEEGDYLTYREIAEQLVPYIHEMNYTHVELMPVQEHPFVPSWGYQVGGFYAVNHRFGSPEEFQWFIDYLHANNIGVILDWVPGHFPKDEHVLSYFDGSHLYEHSDPREGEHKDWGTLIFNYGRHEVKNFLVANAVYWIEKFHIDGIRIDAVASMLYRNYSREVGEWIPNRHGSHENLEAIAFLQQVNTVIHDQFPGVMTIAEESTAFPGVTYPINEGGLGFDYKWNMGWMHDTLDYFEQDPINRKYHQGDLTFTLWYGFSEKFMLVLSHDEVVHGKKSLLEKMPGDDWQKFANLRLLYTYMYGHPGKKLVFMGGEFGMRHEWYEKRSIDWNLLDTSVNGQFHKGVHDMMKDLNRLYKNEPALWEADLTHEGFTWIDYNDRDAGVLAFMRHRKDGSDKLLFVCNMTPVIRDKYLLGVPFEGSVEEIFNSNASQYGGEGTGNFGSTMIDKIAHHGKDQSIRIDLPPLAVTIFRVHEKR